MTAYQATKKLIISLAPTALSALRAPLPEGEASGLYETQAGRQIGIGQADSQQAKSMFRTHSVGEYDPAQAKLTQQLPIGDR